MFLHVRDNIVSFFVQNGQWVTIVSVISAILVSEIFMILSTPCVAIKGKINSRGMVPIA